ncbi:DUF6894 family protein [Sphingomonas sanguinis]|uniref:DUF6894 family protein n=1 Tax=Sphingomonas sanguinis TaxID=33051 RepID=UPI0035A5DCE8
MEYGGERICGAEILLASLRPKRGSGRPRRSQMLMSIIDGYTICRQRLCMRCYFNISGEARGPDQLGFEFGTMARAKVEASCFLADLIRSDPISIWQADELSVEATDEAGLVLFTITVLVSGAPAIEKRLPHSDN